MTHPVTAKTRGLPCVSVGVAEAEVRNEAVPLLVAVRERGVGVGV